MGLEEKDFRLSKLLSPMAPLSIIYAMEKKEMTSYQPHYLVWIVWLGRKKRITNAAGFPG